MYQTLLRTLFFYYFYLFYYVVVYVLAMYNLFVHININGFIVFNTRLEKLFYVKNSFVIHIMDIVGGKSMAE